MVSAVFEMPLFGNRNKRALRVDRSLSIREARYVVFDTELTGLDGRKDSIVSIGAVRMHGGKIDLSNTFYMLANPERPLTRSSVVVHGITPSEVDRKPYIDEVLYEFLRFAGEDVLVGHFVSIDLEFVNREMRRIAGYPIRNPAVDTYPLHEWLKARSPSCGALSMGPREPGLYHIARRFGIPVNGAHNSEIDAFITAQVFQRFIPMLAESGIGSIGGLLEAGAPSKGGDRPTLPGQISNF